MISTLARRVRKLESILQSRTRPAAVFRSGYLKRLPGDTAGARYVAIPKSESTAVPHIELCEFEERTGPPPPGSDDLSFHVYLSSADDPESSTNLSGRSTRTSRTVLLKPSHLFKVEDLAFLHLLRLEVLAALTSLHAG